MTRLTVRNGFAILPLLCGLAGDVAAQENQSGCEPDEIDMGDYCAKRPPESAILRPGAKRATPFRVKSMMPGHASDEPQPAPASKTPEAAIDTPMTGAGFGVQLGVFSTRSKATKVAHDARTAIGGEFALTPMQRNERILWATIHGPFPDKLTAVEAQRRLRQNTPFRDAFVKSLDELELLDPDYATTEK